MKKKKDLWSFTVLPLYLFTLVFVVGPLIYMVALSFATNREGYGVDWHLTLENYRRIADRKSVV